MSVTYLAKIREREVDELDVVGAWARGIVASDTAVRNLDHSLGYGVWPSFFSFCRIGLGGGGGLTALALRSHFEYILQQTYVKKK
jgi:hypothetical protein